MSTSQIEALLIAAFPKAHVSAMLRHFEEVTRYFQICKWEDSIGKGGKFLEASLKALLVRAGQMPEKGKKFKVDGAIKVLGGVPAVTVDEAIRITIPRCIRFVYEIASNRGGRHDSDEINPNEMDASVVLSNCSWILAEMIRHAQRGSSNSDDVKNIVDALMRRKYPLIEDIAGRTYFHKPNASATEVALVILSHKYPKRIAQDELIALLVHNKFTDKNARQAIDRIKRYLDIDENQQFLLLATGLEKAAEIVSKAHAGQT